MIAYKQAPRKRNALAIVNAALSVTFQPDTSVTKSMRLVYGGMAAKTEVATNTAQSVLNRYRFYLFHSFLFCESHLPV